MYLKIETDYYNTYILRVADIRNVSTGHNGNHYVIYVFYRCGTDSDTTIHCGSRDERDEICEKIYQALIAREGVLE